MNLKKKVFLWTAMIAASLAASEMLLWAAGLFIPGFGSIISGAMVEGVVADEELGHRPNPSYPGHDARGFRNRFALKEADIIAMGDSQTYGPASPEDAWPELLAGLTAARVYNMGSGGYGPAHSLILLDEALSMRPRVIIEALYLGNDLYDSYALVYYQGRLPELKTSDRDALSSMKAAEDAEPLKIKVARIFGFGKFRQKDVSGRLTKYGYNSRLLGLLLAAKEALRELLYKNWESVKYRAMRHKDYLMVFDDGGSRTVFTPAYRLCALDLKDPRIREGLRISLESIRRMNIRARASGAELVVLLLPTKESVFGDAVYKSRSNMPGAYKSLLENEEEAREEIIGFLRAEHIGFIDGLPPLKGCLAKGSEPYPVSSDGHPNERGCRVIAHELAGALPDVLR